MCPSLCVAQAAWAAACPSVCCPNHVDPAPPSTSPCITMAAKVLLELWPSLHMHMHVPKTPTGIGIGHLSSVRYATLTVLTFNTIPVRCKAGSILFGLLTTLQHNVSCICDASGCAAGDCSCPCRPSCQTEAATPAVYVAATFGLPEDARWQVCVHSPHAHASEVQSLQGKVLATRPWHQRLSGSI